MIRLPRMSTTLCRATRYLRQSSSLAPLSAPLAVLDRLPRSRPALLVCASSVATATAFRCHATVSAEHAHTPLQTDPSTRPSPSPSQPKIVLYQYEVCPFCNKVRAYLDYHGIAYTVVEVDPLRKTELKGLEDQQYRKVPIAIVDGKQINGSGAVIDAVAGIIGAAGQDGSKDDRLWIEWLDDKLIHFIAPNIYRTPGESLQTFEYITDNAKFSTWQKGSIRYSGAAAMYLIGRRLKKKYGIVDERKEFADALGEWMDAVKQHGGEFLGGKKPGVADLSVYGVLKAIETFDTFAEIVQTNKELGLWYERVKEAVGETAIVART